jgi:RimJ/RimL family protein N-acetyltransferase
MWTYLPYGPFEGPGEMAEYLAWAERSEDPLFFALVPLPGELAAGIASYLHIEPDFGVIEIGHIWFGAPLRRTTAATEAIYLLGRQAFDELGYRRLEWKCNALNAVSRRAAERCGFGFEGVFRNHMVVKGRNRDSAWYAITAEEWPAVRRAYEEWLAPENLGTDLRQKRIAYTRGERGREFTARLRRSGGRIRGLRGIRRIPPYRDGTRDATQFDVALSADGSLVAWVELRINVVFNTIDFRRYVVRSTARAPARSRHPAAVRSSPGELHR